MTLIRLLVVTFGTLLLSTSFGAAQTLIRLSHELPVSHNFHKGLEMLAGLLDKRTNGAVKLEIYPSGQLAKDRTIIKELDSATVDAGLAPTIYWTGIMPISGVFDVPYVITSFAEGEQILNGPVGKKLLAELDKFNMVGLTYFNYGFGDFGNNRRPLQTPADFRGLKIRTNNDIGAKLLQTFGASPTFLSGSEVFVALERGTIDGAHVGLSSVVERKLYEALKYITLDRHNAVIYFVIVRKAVFDKLTAEQKAILRTASEEVSAWVAKKQEEDDLAALDLIKSKGVQLITLTPAQIAEWQKVAEPVRAYWLSKTGEEGATLLKQVQDSVKK